VEDILMELTAERVMSVGIQASSIGGLQESLSTGCHSSQTATEKRSKNHADLANAKKILLFLPEYISPWVGAVNHDNIPHNFEYMLITMYIPKGIHIFRPQLGHII
jgi:hypothetical protein